MDKITLTEAQKAQIMASLAEYRDETGHFDIDIALDGDITVKAKGLVEIETETEYDYYGLVYNVFETHRYAEVELTAFDENATCYSVDEDTQRKAEQLLNAA